MDDLERYEAATEVLAANLAGLVSVMTAGPPEGYYFLRRSMRTQPAEERDRQEWIDGVKRRLGLVTIGEGAVSTDGACPPSSRPSSPRP